MALSLGLPVAVPETLSKFKCEWHSNLLFVNG
jgi:hypothetical protein